MSTTRGSTVSKQELKSRFLWFARQFKEPPTYKEVMKLAPELWKLLLTKYGSYRSFLRSIKYPEPTPTKQQKAFIEYSKKCSLAYWRGNQWSTIEELTWAILQYLEETGFIHNCLFPSKRGSYYKLDFYNVEKKLHIDVRGLFHFLGNSEQRDEEKKVYLLKYGIRTLHLDSKQFEDLAFITRAIRRFINSAIPLTP